MFGGAMVACGMRATLDPKQSFDRSRKNFA